MPFILDGRITRESYKKALIERVAALPRAPHLALVQIGDNRESSAYIEQKKKFGLAIGARVEHIHLPEDTSRAKVESTIAELNSNGDIDGIIIQLPLPGHLDKQETINLISPEKDVDGLTDECQRLLETGSPLFIPATARGIMLLLEFYGISVSGKNVAVFGRSRLVGHPAALLLEKKGATVSVIHSQTKNPREISKSADIVVVAIGKPRAIDASYVKDGAVVVDVGITSVGSSENGEKRKLIGDVDYNSVAPSSLAITPVPGGVGPMTVLSLFDSLIVSAERKHKEGRA